MLAADVGPAAVAFPAYGTTPHLRRSTGLTVVTVAAAVVLVAASSLVGPAAGLVAVTAGLGCVRFVQAPVAVAWVTAGVLPAVSGIARGVPVPALRIGELLLVAMAVVAIASATRLVRGWHPIETSLLAYAVVTFGMGAFGIVRNGTPAGFDSVSALLGPFQYVVIVRVIVLTATSPSVRRRAVRWMLGASVPVSLAAILQYFRVAGVDVALQPLTSEDFAYYSGFMQARATGLFEHWHTLAGYLLVVVLLLVELLLRREHVMRPVHEYVVLALAVAAMLLTLTFTTFGIAVVGALVLAWRHRALTRLLTAGVAIVGPAMLAFAPFVGGRLTEQFSGDNATTGDTGLVPQTIAYRFTVWGDEYLPALRGRVFAGYGPELPPDIRWPYTESVYIELLLRGGSLLMLAFVVWMLVTFVTSRRLVHHDDPVVGAAATVLALLVVLLVPMHAVFPYLLTTGLPQQFCVLAALVVAGAAERSGPLR